MTANDLIGLLKAYGFQGSGLLIILFVIWAFLRTDWVSNKITKIFNGIIGNKKDSSIFKSHITSKICPIAKAYHPFKLKQERTTLFEKTISTVDRNNFKDKIVL